MNEQSRDAFEERSRALFDDSVSSLDFALRSRLTQARHAAMDAASARRPWLPLFASWKPVAGVSAAAILGAFLWLGSPLDPRPITVSADGQSNLEDLEIVASSDEGADDAMDMFQDDIEFYDWADKAANSAPSAQG